MIAHKIGVSVFSYQNENSELISRGMLELVPFDLALKGKILQQIESRLDEELNFFLRFDKDEWVNHKKLILTDSGRCFHIKVSVAAFPKKRENAMKIISDFFKQ